MDEKPETTEESRPKKMYFRRVLLPAYKAATNQKHGIKVGRGFELQPPGTFNPVNKAPEEE